MFGTLMGGSGPVCGATSYANAGGTGNRTASITVTISADLLVNNDPPQIVDGDTTSNAGNSSSGAAVSGFFFKFDFGAGASKLITEFKFYQNAGSQPHGTFQFQGSDNDSTWTDIGAAFVLAGDNLATSTHTEMSGNTTGYRYYRLLGVSGNMLNGCWLREFEFKISACA